MQTRIRMEKHSMKSQQGKRSALWIRTAPQTHYPSLPGDLSVDVAVVGGGIAGLTAALLLKRSGANVAVVESNEIAKGVSGHTTGKITVAHGLIYDYLQRRFGRERARQYAEANQQAIEFIGKFIEKNAVACDYHRTFACTYSTREQDRKRIRNEVRAAGALGLPVSYTESTFLPFPVMGAIWYENQAFFHPRKYLLSLAEGIPGGGSYIFEHTRVKDVQETKPCRVVTDRGALSADQVVVTSHFPILDRGFFFAKMIPRRAYLMAFRIGGETPEGMYHSMAPPFHTLRKHVAENGETYLLLGGEDHLAGQENDALERYARIEAFARNHFNVQSVLYRWSTQDNDPVDRIPFVGRHSRFSSRIFVATGFRGWGISNGTAAAIILSDLISGRPNPWSPVFDSNRFRPYRSIKFYTRNLQVAGSFIKDYLKGAAGRAPADLARGQGAITAENGREVAAFKDGRNRIHLVSPRCTHMKCLLKWNNAEQTWDCPCHGSRFSPTGRVLQAPAVEDLRKENA